MVGSVQETAVPRESHPVHIAGFFSAPQQGWWLIEARVSFVMPRASGFRKYGNKINMPVYPSVEHIIWKHPY